jgi:putative ABC transport system substrate-binding protein
MAIHIGRRDFITLLGGAAAAWPCAARAQQSGKKYTIGLFSAGIRLPENSPAWIAFLSAMRELGWIEGKNVVFEGRYADNRLERLPALAEELVRLNVGVIVAVGTLAPLAAKRATPTIPIVMTGEETMPWIDAAF